MTPEDLLGVAERALGHARGEALATAARERSLLSRFARSRPTQATAVDNIFVEVTCVREGRVASATAGGTGDDQLREAAGRASAAAEAAARAGSGAYPGLPVPAGPPLPHDGWDAETARLDPREAGRALGTAFEVAEAAGLEAFGTWTAGEVSTALASSAGARSLDRVTDAHFKVICRDGDGASGYAARTASASRELRPVAAAEEAARKAAPGERETLEPGAYDVVLDAPAVGVLLDFLGRLAFDGLAHAEGRGALAGRLGTRVAAARIDLTDSPAFPATLPRAFDAEGVPNRPLPLIQDGVARRVVHDTRSAALAGRGAVSTGHALVAGGSPGGPAPTNLVLSGGAASGVEELASPVRRGLYVTRLWYVNPVHPRRALLTGVTRDGTFLIEDGRITRPLRDVRFTDSALRILDATQALSSRPRLVSEAEFYGRRFAYGVVCPALRAGGFRVSGGA